MFEIYSLCGLNELTIIYNKTEVVLVIHHLVYHCIYASVAFVRVFRYVMLLTCCTIAFFFNYVIKRY